MVRLCRIATSFRFIFAVLLAIAVCCLWRGILPGPNQLERMASEIRDPKFRNWYGEVNGKKEKAALSTVLDAYGRTFGSAVWARHAEEELGECGAPRFFDLAELAMSIDNGEDRIAFVEAHKDTYSVIASSGASELASSYAQRLSKLRQTGGRDWIVVQRNPLAVAVYAAVDGDAGLWAWYLDNRDWVDDYIVALSPDPDSENPETVLVEVLKEFRHRPKIYRALRDEVIASPEATDGAGASGNLDAHTFLVGAMGTISLYGDMFEVLCAADVPFGEALDVFANNIDDLRLDTPEDCKKTGIELANIYRSHKGVWNAASVLGGDGAVRYFREVPAYAETVLASFGEAGILPFLMQNYADSPELLSVASEAIVRYEAIGWTFLANFAGNGEFKRALLHKDVGAFIVPYVALKGGDSTAIAQCLDDPRWVKRYLNPDGSFKPETESIIEAMPFVGGIATVVKHQMHGEPVTMEEIGWAAFDVVDDAVTIAAVVGVTVTTGGAGTAPAVAAATAKKTAIEAAKAEGKILIKQGSKQLLKQSAKNGAKYTAKRGGAVIVRKGVEMMAGQETKALVRHTITRRLVQTVGHVGSWTVRMSGKSIRLVASPLTKTVATWRKLPPAARVRILKAGAAVLFFVAIMERTIPKLPGAIHETLKSCGEQVGKLVNETVKGVADGLLEAVRASMGFSEETSNRLLQFGLSAVAFACALLLLFRHRRAMGHAPARLA